MFYKHVTIRKLIMVTEQTKKLKPTDHENGDGNISVCVCTFGLLLSSAHEMFVT